MPGVEHAPFTLFLLGLFAFISIWALLSGLRILLGLNPERHWVPVPGVICELNVNGNRRRQPLIRYSYEYQGRRHTSEAVSPIKELYMSRNGAMVAARRYPYGANVTVFVNPQDPSQAVLEPIPKSGEALTATLRGVGGLLVVAILYLNP